ncbi:hypothetical protein ABK040_014475 [Willaertia magna]
MKRILSTVISFIFIIFLFNTHFNNNHKAASFIHCQTPQQQEEQQASSLIPPYGRPIPIQRCDPSLYLICNQICPNGISYGINKVTGCPFCKCHDNPNYPTCPPVTCLIYCEYGFEIDPVTRCEICKCRQQPNFCPSFAPCNLVCPFGYRRAPSGCLICLCNEDPLI